MLFVFGCAGRILYCIYGGVRKTPPDSDDIVFTTVDWLPTYLFFSCYWLVLATWIEGLVLHKKQNAISDSSTALLDDSRQFVSMRTFSAVMMVLNFFFLIVFLLISLAEVVAQAVFKSGSGPFRVIYLALQIVCLLSFIFPKCLFLHFPLFVLSDNHNVLFFAQHRLLHHGV